MFVFLSHAGEDAGHAKDLANVLRQAGHEVWLDVERLQPGQQWMKEIEQALAQSAAFIVYVGRSGVVNWVDRETQFAIDRATKSPGFALIPILGPEAAKPETLPPFLRQHQAIVCREWPPLPAQLQSLAQQIGPSSATLSLLPPGTPPFVGLKAFKSADALRFFGRDDEIVELVNKVGANPIVTVIGASGSGKSSLVRAGLVPALLRGRLSAGSSAWRVAVSRPGDDPFRELAEALPQLNPDLTPAQSNEFLTGLAARLAADTASLRVAIASLVPQDVETLLVIDQFEEIFTLTPKPDIRKSFIAALLAAAQTASSRPVRIVITLRADFLAQLMEFRNLLSADYKVYRPGREQLQQIIERPLALAGAAAEPHLIRQLLDDAGDEPGNLPLLEFALDQLWEKRTGNLLTLSAYDAIDRLDGAIARHAGDTFHKLSPDQQKIAIPVLARLVRVSAAGEEGADTRQRIRTADLDQPTLAILEAFVQARLLVLSVPKEDQVIEIAHEALLKTWDPLRKWIENEENRRFLLWRQTLNVLRTEWEQAARLPDGLLRGAQLSLARKSLKERKTELMPVERDYIQQSLRAQGISQSRTYAISGIAALAALLALLYWLYTRSDSYLVSHAISDVPLREALASSRSDDDPYLIAVQDWICTLTARQSNPEVPLHLLPATEYNPCFELTAQAAQRAVQSSPLTPLPALAKNLDFIARPGPGAGAELVCVSNLPLTTGESKMILSFAQSYTGADPGDDWLRYRDAIEVLQSLVNLGDLETVHRRTANLLKELSEHRLRQQQEIVALLASRLGPGLASESLESFQKLLVNPYLYYGWVVYSAFTREKATRASAAELHAMFAQLPGNLFSDSIGVGIAGFILARLVHSNDIQFAMDECRRWSQPTSTNRFGAVALITPVSDSLAFTGRTNDALLLAEEALTAANAINQEEARSRALANVAIVFARCHKLPRARAIADRCARSLDKLRAFTAIVAAGSNLTLPNPLETRPACCQALRKP